jgi:hypothetical protein
VAINSQAVLEPIPAAQSAAIKYQAALEPITAARSAAINSQAMLEPKKSGPESSGHGLKTGSSGVY